MESNITPVVLLDEDVSRCILAIVYVPKNEVDDVAKVVEEVKSTVDNWTMEDIKEACFDHESWYFEEQNFASMGV